MADYETLRTRHAREAEAGIPQHQERIAWAADRLAQERTQRLRALVAMGQERSPWHRARLAHIDADAVTEADLASIPPMTKHDLMENFDGIMTDRRLDRALVESHLESLNDDRYLLDEFHVVASGGSSGTRGVFVYDWDGWLQCRLLLLRYSIRFQDTLFGQEGHPVTAFIAAGKATHMTFAMTRTFGSAAGITPVPATLPISEIVGRLNDMQPQVIGGYPTMLYALTAEARAGRLRIAPRLIRPGSEPLLPEIRSALDTTWGAPVINIYGTSEGASASACGMGSGMHLNEDLVIFEAVDREGRPVPAGTRADKLYVTNLYNHATPLIRYEMTDETTIIDEPCPCGSSMRRMADIEGRTDDVFMYADGVMVHPLAFRSVLGRERAIVEYQVSQTADGAAVRIRTTPGEPLDSDGLGAHIETELVRLGVAGARVTVEVVEGFDRQATGKLKRFVPMG